MCAFDTACVGLIFLLPFNILGSNLHDDGRRGMMMNETER